MSWHTGPLAAFDLETTGVNVETDRVVTACVARVDGSGQARPSAATWLADPGIDIPAKATQVHGVTTDRARAEGQPAEHVVAETTAMLVRALDKGIPIVGFNVAFDLTLLDRECRRYSLPTLTDLTGGCAPVVCGRVLDKHVSYRRGPRKLVDVARHWNVALHGAHDAAADAVAAAGVVVRIARQHPTIANAILQDLHVRQIGWHREQCESYAGYLRGRVHSARTVEEQLELATTADRVAAEAGQWPIVPFERQEQLG